jgi:hypothetical protein
MSVHESTRTVENRTHLRLPLKTHIIQPGEDIAEVVERYTKDLRQPGNIITGVERPTAVCEKPTPARLSAPGSPK